LKQALEKVLPSEVLYSPKRGFGAPIREWFQGQTGQILEDHLMNSSMRSRNFLNYSFIARLIDEHRRGTHDRSGQLWCLLNLSLWYERWIDRG
jgi:asparagine synthase (glutamine-hydrolysing)